MNILVRTIEAGDTRAVNKLSAQLGYPHSIGETEARIKHLLQSDSNCVLVAVKEDEIVAWLHAFKATWLESGMFAEIAGLVVDEAHRGQNIGELLVQAARSWATEQKAPVLRVRSNVLRTRAHQFYLRTGFTELKESKVFEMIL